MSNVILFTMTVIHRTDTNAKLYWDEYDTSRKYVDSQVITGLAYVLGLDKAVNRDRNCGDMSKKISGSDWDRLLYGNLSGDSLYEYVKNNLEWKVTDPDNVEVYVGLGGREEDIEMINNAKMMRGWNSFGGRRDEDGFTYKFEDYVTMYYYMYDGTQCRESNQKICVIVCSEKHCSAHSVYNSKCTACDRYRDYGIQ